MRITIDLRDVPVASRPFPGDGSTGRRMWESSLAWLKGNPLVQIQLFGGVGAVTDGGEAIDVGPSKCQALLAALALSPGAAVPVSRLVDLVWGAEPPRTAEKTLQSYVTRLRKGLGSEAIERVGAAYRLSAAAETVDVIRFQRHVESGAHDLALAEWGGVPLAGLDAAGFASTVDGLVEQWLGVMEIDLERQIDSDTPSIIGTLTELTADYPFREGLWALLMTALYRVGRQGDALAAYQRARHHLVEQLGVEPGPRLRELEASILDHDEGLGASRGAAPVGLGLPSGTVTFGFSDLIGSARLWLSSRQEMTLAMARYDELLRAAVGEHHGFVFATDGDSFGVAFHRPSQATAWALDLQAAVGAERWPGDLDMQVCVGLHTGETEEQGNDYFGPTVNVASRLAAAGHGGQILLSGATAALVVGEAPRDLGTFRLDDMLMDQNVFQIDGGDHGPLRVESGRRGNLARRSDRLIGREQALEQVTDALGSSAIVTLVGPGGIGKTRLALAGARLAEANGRRRAWLVELAGLASSNDVARAVAATLTINETTARSLSETIVGALEGRNDLILLDNCEHVIDGAAAMAQSLAEGCPDVSVLATSREGLGLAGEQLIAVAPLDHAGPAVELFNERARSVSQSFDLEADRSSVGEICRRLDGVPLAIELAAARTRTLSPSDIVTRLDDRLRLLTGGRRTGVERHRTLRATIQWSFDLLSSEERELFERLSIFAGPFDLEAAHLVAADTEVDLFDLDDLLGGLVERSMLIVESGPFGRRFRLLETMRQFGADRLAEMGQTDGVAKRHARWCGAKVTEIEKQLTGLAEVEGANRLDELWPNLRAAFDWAIVVGDVELATSLVAPIATEVSLRNQTEIGDWAERLLDIVPADDESLRLTALVWASFRYMLSQDHQAYELLLQRHDVQDHALVEFTRALVYDDDEAMLGIGEGAVVELRRLGQHHAAELIHLSGVVGPMLATGRFEEHDAAVAELVERYRRSGPPTFLHWTYFMLGYSAAFQGDHERAESFFERSSAIDVPKKTMSVNRPVEARTALRHGDRARAFELLKAHLDDMYESDNVMLSRLACVEFINMMAIIDRLADGAVMLGYLEKTGPFGELSARTVVAEVAAVIDGHPDFRDGELKAKGRAMADHEAIGYMRDLMGQLADEAIQAIW